MREQQSSYGTTVPSSQRESREKAQHTPGPWSAVDGHEVHDKPTTFDSSGARVGCTPNRICLIEYPYGNREGKDANARLIAAAPELLEALDELTLVIGLTPIAGNKDVLQESLDKARSAIAKAEGGVK